MKSASPFAVGHAAFRIFFLVFGVLGLAYAGLGLSLIIGVALRSDEFVHLASSGLLLVFYLPGMLAGGLSVEMLTQGYAKRARLTAFYKRFFPVALLAAGFGIVVDFRFHPGAWFYVMFGVMTYVLLAMGAVVAAVSIARGHRQ